ncbi:MAG: hypothetical protein ACYCPS_02295 [Candidatus Saccharimonadales bacterium]
MAISSKFFRDHYILLLLTINVFLFLVVAVFVIVRLSGLHSSSYIVQCRNCSDPTATNKYLVGGVSGLLSFIVFSLVVLVINITLSLKSYNIHRQLAIAILSLGILLQVLTLAVSNALLVLR